MNWIGFARLKPGAIACAARGVATSVAGTAASVRRRVPRSSSFIAAAASAATASAARRTRPSTPRRRSRPRLRKWSTILFTSGGPLSCSHTSSAASRIRRATIAAFDWLWLRAISCGCATWKMATARGGASSPPATRTSCSNESSKTSASPSVHRRHAVPTRICVGAAAAEAERDREALVRRAGVRPHVRARGQQRELVHIERVRRRVFGARLGAAQNHFIARRRPRTRARGRSRTRPRAARP